MRKTNQAAEITKIQSWLQAWHGESHEPRLDQKTRRQIEELSRLTGAEFGQAYMTMVIPHHAMAAMMAIDCLNQAYHPEMRDMCAMMLGMQGDESAQLRLWLQQWYGVNDLDRRDRT